MTDNKKMTTKRIAWRNIKNKPHRTFAMMFMTAVICLTLFLSSFTIISLKGGIESLSLRMGADIIVVPEGYDSKITGAILRGEPNTFYLPESVIDRVRKVEGVKSATPQLFLATLSAGCCSFPIQIIGIDTDTDFMVIPWLRKQVELPIKDGTILVGYNIVGNYDETVRFFNQPFQIAGRLAQTGMGFDNSVFMSIDEARRLAKEFEKILGNEDKNLANSYSSVMVKIEPGYSSNEVREAIFKEFEGERIYPLISKQMMTEISENMNHMMTYLYMQIVIIWILAFAILAIVYSFSIKERKREIATLRIIGATKRKMRSILFSETLIINLIGALGGGVLGFVSSILFSKAISEKLSMPFLNPSMGVLFVLLLLVVALGTLLGPVASFLTINNMTKTEIQLLLREND